MKYGIVTLLVWLVVLVGAICLVLGRNGGTDGWGDIGDKWVVIPAAFGGEDEDEGRGDWKGHF